MQLVGPVLGRSQGRLVHPLRRLFGRGRLQEVCGRQCRVSLLWRGQVHGRGAVNWRRAAVAHGETALQLEVLFLHPTMAQIIERYNLNFHESPAGAAPVDATANAPTAAPTAAPATRHRQRSHRRLGSCRPNLH